MCGPACIDFGRSCLAPTDVKGKRVLEVGAFDVNGSLRGIAERLGPSQYLGVDIAQGTGVDEICSIYDIAARYGRESFDVVICTEVMEHVRDWRAAVSNLKTVLKTGGILILTTRSKGCGYHAYPFDFWRYEVDELSRIFGDLSIEAVQSDPTGFGDPEGAGVFLKARKPASFRQADVRDCALFSIMKGRRCANVSEMDLRLFKAKMELSRLVSRMLPRSVKEPIKAAFVRICGDSPVLHPRP